MTSSPATMRAVRLSAPGPVDNLRLTTLPLPPERDGWVRIRVEAFGLNRSELKLRLGLSVGVSFPRVPGIEAAGTVDAAPPGSGLAAGQKAVAMMGDMGRTYDGGYAEYTSVPLSQVIPVDTDLPREAFQEILDAVARPAGLPRGPRLRRPGAGAAGPRRHGARPRHRQARRPRPALEQQSRHPAAGRAHPG